MVVVEVCGSWLLVAGVVMRLLIVVVGCWLLIVVVVVGCWLLAGVVVAVVLGGFWDM